MPPDDSQRLLSLQTNNAVLDTKLDRVADDVESLRETIESLSKNLSGLQAASERHAASLERLFSEISSGDNSISRRLLGLEARLAVAERWIEQAKWPLRLLLTGVAGGLGIMLLYVWEAVKIINSK